MTALGSGVRGKKTVHALYEGDAYKDIYATAEFAHQAAAEFGFENPRVVERDFYEWLRQPASPARLERDRLWHEKQQAEKKRQKAAAKAQAKRDREARAMIPTPEQQAEGELVLRSLLTAQAVREVAPDLSRGQALQAACEPEDFETVRAFLKKHGAAELTE